MGRVIEAYRLAFTLGETHTDAEIRDQCKDYTSSCYIISYSFEDVSMALWGLKCEAVKGLKSHHAVRTMGDVRRILDLQLIPDGTTMPEEIGGHYYICSKFQCLGKAAHPLPEALANAPVFVQNAVNSSMNPQREQATLQSLVRCRVDQ